MASTFPDKQRLAEPEPSPSTRILRNGLIVGVLVLLGLILVGLSVVDRSNGRETDTKGMTRTVEGGSVTVAATWEGLAADPVFDITMDTHSVNLDDFDLSKLAVLRVDGVEVQPIEWDAATGGHHREGTLTFSATAPDGSLLIGPETATIELVVRDVAGVPERIFQWNP
jgi:hypothetical protein